MAARVLGLALGYEDLNDHDTLRQSKLWSLLCGAAGRGGRKASWQELPPGKSTLNRMELTGPALEAGERYKKIVADTARLDALLVDLFLDWHGPQPERIVLDVDATDDPLHGRQERDLAGDQHMTAIPPPPSSRHQGASGSQCGLPPHHRADASSHSYGSSCGHRVGWRSLWKP